VQRSALVWYGAVGFGGGGGFGSRGGGGGWVSWAREWASPLVQRSALVWIQGWALVLAPV